MQQLGFLINGQNLILITSGILHHIFVQVQHLKLCQFACLCSCHCAHARGMHLFFHLCVVEYFFGKHDRIFYVVIQVTFINTFQSTIANFAHKAHKNCFLFHTDPAYLCLDTHFLRKVVTQTLDLYRA